MMTEQEVRIVLKMVEHCSFLADGWNGEESKAFCEATIERSKRLIMSMCSFMLISGVIPIQDGTIVIYGCRNNEITFAFRVAGKDLIVGYGDSREDIDEYFKFENWQTRQINEFVAKTCGV